MKHLRILPVILTTLALAWASPALAVTPVDGNYAGTTSQDLDMGFTVGAGGTALTDMGFTFELTCKKSGTTVLTGVGFGLNVPIVNGEFEVNFRGVFFSLTAKGKFTSATDAKGKMTTIWAVLNDSNKAEVCTAKRIGWTAAYAPAGAKISRNGLDYFIEITVDGSGKEQMKVHRLK